MVEEGAVDLGVSVPVVAGWGVKAVGTDTARRAAGRGGFVTS